MKLRTILVIGLVTFVSCAPARYEYAPATITDAEVAGYSAAYQAIPPESPRGDVRIAMLGMALLHSTRGLDDSTLGAVHIAFVVSNHSDEPWSVDPGKQRLEISTRHERVEIDATTIDIARPSMIEVPPRSTRRVDAYFPLPIRFQAASELPAFDVIWSIHTGAREVTRRTTFARFRIDHPPTQDQDLVSPGAPPGAPPNGDSMLPGTAPPSRRPAQLPSP